MNRIKNGYLLIGAVVLVLVFGLVATSITYIAITESHTAANRLEGQRAFNIAQAGLHKGLYGVINRVTTCSAITGNPDFTDIIFAGGDFSVTGTLYNPSSTTLTANINATASIIPVASLTGYAPFGQVQIGSEIIYYSAYSLNSGTCGGSPPCLIGASRGKNNSEASNHSAGSLVYQNQCHVESIGGYPDLTNPRAMRVVSEELLEDTRGQGWIVGNSVGGGEMIARWTGATWVREGPSSSVPDAHLNAVAVISPSDAWAVGQLNDGYALILHWDGSGWSRVMPDASVPAEDLNNVKCLDSNNCWAVGDDKTFIQYNGASWFANTTSAVPSKNIYGLSCVSANDCWATGEKEGTALIIHWNGSYWERADAGTTAARPLYGAFCNDANDCWVVGSNETFSHWDGLSWSGVTPEASVKGTVRAVTCLNGNDCWAVGNQIGGQPMFAHWDGASWVGHSSVGVSPHTLNAVDCILSNDCWAVGQSQTIAHYDGVNWSNFTPDPSVPEVNMNGVSMFNYEGGSVSQMSLPAFWHEAFS